MNFSILIKQILLLLLFFCSLNITSQNIETIDKNWITLKKLKKNSSQKSKLVLIDSPRVASDFLNDSLFSSFYKTADTTYSYATSSHITISQRKAYYKQGRMGNIFDTITDRLIEKYFIKYKWRFPGKKKKGDYIVSLYLIYAADDKYFLIEISEFRKSKSLNIYRKKIPFSELTKFSSF
jgi:hypothetical protein